MLTGSTDGMPPEWVPPAARLYLAHTEHGTSIRALARAEGCHASTVLRRIRRYEQRRDDPLVDHALRRLGAQGVGQGASTPGKASRGKADMIETGESTAAAEPAPTEATIEKEARRILRRLAEPGACLAVAGGMETAVVVREAADGQTVRTAVVARTVAEAMALRDWIASKGAGRVARYHLTAAGREALKRLVGEVARDPVARASEGKGRVRYGLAESPLLALSRRRDRDGTPFLDEAIMAAGERLREDFELAQMGGTGPANWEKLVQAPADSVSGDLRGTGPDAARTRVAMALRELGPGLGDVVLRCCCYLEGMETVERRMGWAARSGKIVLRIALQRLRRHYDETEGRWSPLIG